MSAKAEQRKATRKLTPVSFTDVDIKDGFWSPRTDTNRKVSIPHSHKMLTDNGYIDAIKQLWKPGDPSVPHIFWDSDVAKWLEAACYTLSTNPSKKVEGWVEEVVSLFESAQQPDGYLNTHYTPVEPQNRWSNLRDNHELYCAGHLMEAAVAHYEATGRRTMLDVMCRYADYIGKVFGRGKGQKRGYPGHEEIELGLVKLYRATGEKRYLKLSKFFVDERGRKPHYYDKEAKARGDDPASYWARTYDYCQADKPVREQAEATGHAVRAMYLYSGMADVAAETGDTSLITASKKLWRNVVDQKMYVTGGIGARHSGESFGRNYELGNESAYAETCAAIGLVFWSHRLLQMEAKGEYADVMELALYNGFLSGVGLDGKHFFYVNPLAHCGDHGEPRTVNRRQPWFGCACCPSNVVRMLASLGSYIYSTTQSELYVHLYIGGEGRAAVAGKAIAVRQTTDYPRTGDIWLDVTADAPARFTLCLRIPGWCRKAKVKINGKAVELKVRTGYARLSRTWQSGDRVELSLDMPIKVVHAHPAVADTAGRVALQRGPLVYCVEESDHKVDVRSLALPAKATLKAVHEPKLLGGTTVITGGALAPSHGEGGALYASKDPTTKKVALTAIPYHAWANREPGSMAVWLRREG